MIARASQLFLPTLRDAPADAEAANHKLLVRGGFVRQVTGGVWTFLPLGWRVHRKIEQIIREEQDAIGAQEMLMPVLTPAELWEATGRDFIQELFRLKDRKGTDYVLPMTHEETVAFHARELHSYKQLPQMLYHISTKARDEPRPRAGLIRLREFWMKDAYSFDRDDEGLAKNFETQHGAYVRTFERVGLKTYAVEAESGMMGGTESVDFLAPADAGENTLVTCENRDFAADIEVARTIPRAAVFPETLLAPEEIETPGVKTCEALAEFTSIDVAATSKAMPVTTDEGVVLALIRGDDRIEPAKLEAALVKQNHDENGIIWPRSVAPYDVHVVVVKGAEEIGEQAAAALDAAGFDVLLDDRDRRPGEKFADADLIGIPTRITAGKKSLEDGAVDVRDRATGEERRVNVADLGKEVG